MNATRREILRKAGLTGALITIPAIAGAVVSNRAEAAVCAAPPVSAHDPLLEAIEEYRAGLAAYDAADELEDGTPEAEAFIAATWGKLYFAETLPAPTTSAGAAAAIQCALDEDALIDDVVERLLRAVLAYLGAQAARGL